MAVRHQDLPADLFPMELRPYIKKLNIELRDLHGLEGSLTNPLDVHRSDGSVARQGRAINGEVTVEPTLTAAGTVAFYQLSTTPIAPSNLAFWLKTTQPAELYVCMKQTDGTWNWVPLAFAA